MVLAGQIPEGLLNLVRTGIARDAKRGVIVFELGGYVRVYNELALRAILYATNPLTVFPNRLERSQVARIEDVPGGGE